MCDVSLFFQPKQKKKNKSIIPMFTFFTSKFSISSVGKQEYNFEIGFKPKESYRAVKLLYNTREDFFFFFERNEELGYTLSEFSH